MEQELEYTDTNSTDYIDLNTDSDGDEIGDSIADWATIKIQPELVDEDEKQLSKSRYGHSRTIIHLDIDCFYAQVEMAKNESLRNKPLGIRQKHIIVTCNYPARELGVGKLVTLKKALEKCPNLVVIAGEDLTEYRQVSFKVTDYLKNFSSKVHRLGFDENYVDVTEQIELKLKQMQDRSEEVQSLQVVGYLYQNSSTTKKETCDCNCHQRMIIGSQIAADMRDGLWNMFHLTSSAGIAHNMLISKIASGLHKPNLQTTVNPDDALDLLHSLELRKIAGIGSATSKRLRSVGITTVKELSCIPLAVLKTHFPTLQARMLFQCCRGVDDNDVITAAKPKSIGVEDSFSECSSMEASKKRISDLIKHLLPRLTDGCENPQTVKLTIIKHSSSSYKRECKQCSVPCTFFSTKDPDKRCSIILDIMLNLLRKMIDPQKPFRLRLFGVTFTNFKDKPPAASLSISTYLQQSNSKNCDEVNKKSSTTNDNTVRDNNYLQTSSNHHHNKDNQELQQDIVPEDIDLEVFSQLPQQMKKELLNEWGKRNRDIKAVASPKRKKEGTILHYFGRS